MEGTGAVAPTLTEVEASERNGSALDQFWLWAGANIAVTNWALGVLPIEVGLSLRDAIAMMVLGNLLGGVLFALCTLPGKNTGLTAMLLTRISFGRKGALPITVLQLINNVVWVGINSFFAVNVAVEVAAQLGMAQTTLTTVVTVLVIFVVQVLVAVFGFRFIRNLDRFAVPLMALLMIAMTFFAFQKPILWTHSSLAGMERFGMMAMVFAAAGIGWPLSWATWAADYARHAAPALSNRKLFWSSYLGVVLPTIWLEIVGAVIAASMGTGMDPAAMVTRTVPGFALPALLLIFLGTVSTNMIDVESGGLSLQALGARLPHWGAAAISGGIGFGICLTAIAVNSIASVMDQWMLTLILWITPWTAIALLDLFVFHREQLRPHEAPQPRPGIRWAALGSWIVGFGFSLLFANTPLFTGPFSNWAAGADFSWAVGLFVTAALYLFWQRAAEQTKREPSPLTLESGEPV
ncbi:MAG: cytosine permease [Firmicutes bacterium]|nr:cytosine permease [Bacillota bacterium]